MKAYEECYREAEDYGTPLPAELIAKAYGSKKLLSYSRRTPLLLQVVKPLRK